MPTNQESPQSSPTNNRLNLGLDLRLVSVVLLAVIIAMLLIWRPWSSTSESTRTIQVTGEATVSAEPDEFVFSPSYQAKSTDKAAALTELTAKSSTIVDELKKLGVSDKAIKVDSSGYDFPTYRKPGGDGTTYTLGVTVTVTDRELAQKVQNYLLSTTPTGAVTPQAGFSDVKQDELENKARDEATKEARAKADQSAANLGFKVGKVKAVEDGAGFNDVVPYGVSLGAELEDSVASPKIDVQPGVHDFNYSVTVTYYLR